MLTIQNIAASVILLALVLWQLLLKKSKGNPQGLPFPPGPKPLPLIGNALDMPNDYPWKTFQKWCKQYGDLVYINVVGQPILIVGSAQVAYDLFERKSSIYSGRAHSTMVVDLMGWGWSFGMMNYGDQWKHHRKTFHQHFNQNIVEKYRHIQMRESRMLLSRLLENPGDFLKHIRITFAATIMDIGYGIQVKDNTNEYIHIAERALEGLSAAAVPGAFLVDQIPWLKYVPSWFPGAGFRRKAAEWKLLASEMPNKPFNDVKAAVKRGDATPSIVATLLEGMSEDGNRAEERVARNVAGVAYAGGADTTVAAVQSFFLAMVCYPEVQKKAQAELVSIVGHDCLPDFDVRDQLPYINAIIKETMRWQPVTPLAVPHYTNADDIYNGQYIPAGSIVMGNVWSMLHDPAYYPNPTEFKPERFLKEDGTLNPDVKDPDAFAFGFGRRICPGRFLSDSSLYSVITSVLSVYDLLPPLDEKGNEIKIKPEWTTGLVQYPLPYNCRIKPRSKAAEQLIKHSRDTYA